MARRDRDDRRRGREQHARSKEGRVRRPRLDRYYGPAKREVRPGDFEFRFDLIRVGPLPNLSLNKSIESAEWRDDAAVLTGTLAMRRPEPDRPKSLPIARGHLVRCRARQRGDLRWRTLWRMRMGFPETNVEDGSVTVELSDDLDILRRNRRQWRIRKGKRRKRGWFAHEVARIVARREGIRLGRIAKGTKRMNKPAVGEFTALDVLRKAYKFERDKTGRRFVIRMDYNGRLEILPFRRNRLLYVFGDQLRSALVSQQGKERPVTVLEAKGRIGKGKDAKKVSVVIHRRPLSRALGYRHDERNYGRVQSKAELREEAQRDYARGVRVKPSARVTVPGVPWIRRGEGVYLRLPREGFRGDDDQTLSRAFVYCSSVVHRVAGSDGFTSEFEVRVDDPFYKDAKRQEREERQRKRKAKQN